MGECGSQGQRREERRQGEGEGEGEAVAWAGLGRCISAGPSLERFAAIINRARQ